VTPQSVRKTASLERLRGPAEVAQAIPYLLGFHPQESLVLVGLARRELMVTARIDLADAEVMLADTIASMVRGGSEEILAVIYDDAAAAEIGAPFTPMPFGELALAVVDRVEAARCEFVDMMLVGRGRWWSYLCREPACCPPDGRPIPAAPSPFAAAATVAGVVALPSRSALAAQLAPAPGREALLPALRAAEHRAVGAIATGDAERRERSAKRAIFAAARATQGPVHEPLGQEELVRYAVGLRSIAVRDAVWIAIDNHRLDGRELWRELATRAPEPFDAAPLFLFAWRSWRAGDGALARIAAEDAVASDPAYSAADLLLAALSTGTNPRQVPRLRSRPARRR
jgi:hypothetical protein